MRLLLEKCRNSFEPEWQRALDFIEKEELPNRRRALILTEKLRKKLSGQMPEWLQGDFLFHLIKLFSFSQFLGDFLVKHTDKLPELKAIYKKRFLSSDFRVELLEKETEKSFMNRLRIYKNLQMSRVVLRDILGLADFQELVRDVTLIHDACIKAALSFAEKVLKERYGEPTCGFTVVDMGKAGGYELNYSSDIDLIFVYESRYGETTGGSYGKLQNHDYFTILSKYLVELLTKNTDEGICMNVDLRLRPNGTMGPLCNDIEALEQYYTAVARPWERFALLKARPSAGDLLKTGTEFLKLARAFVFRKYIDLTLIEELLRLKELIKAKVLKKGKKIDLKLSEGGIRELEFIVQAFQLIYGGKHPYIRSKNTLIALRRLFKWGFLQEKEYEELKEAYIFLRKAEHMLQITNFRQTQTFHPGSEEAEELAKEHLNQTPDNSSRPPSSRDPWSRNKDDATQDPPDDSSKEDAPSEGREEKSNKAESKKGSPGQRSPGRQKGSQGYARTQQLPVTSTEFHYPSHCFRCGAEPAFDKAVCYTGFESINAEFGDSDSPGLQITNTKHLSSLFQDNIIRR